MCPVNFQARIGYMELFVVVAIVSKIFSNVKRVLPLPA